MVRLLSPQDYGLNAMLQVPIELFFLFSTFGIDSAIIRYGNKNKEQLSSAFGYLLVINISIFITAITTAEIISVYFKEPRLVGLIQAVSVVFVLAPFRTIPNALLDIALDFKLKSQIEFFSAIASSIAALTMALFGFGVWALVSALILNALFKAIFLAYYHPWFVVPSLRIIPIFNHIKYGFFIMTEAAIGVISGSILTFMAGPVIGVEALGIFAVATVFAMLPLSKVMPVIQPIMFPLIAKLINQPLLAKQAVLNSLELSSIIIFPVAVGTACLSENIVSVIFGAKWVAAGLPLSLLSLLIPLQLIGQIYTAPCNAAGHARSVATVHLVKLAILFGGSFFAINFGILGLIFLTAVAVGVSTTIFIFIGHRIFTINFYELVIAIAPSLMGSLVMAFALIYINNLTFFQGVFGLIASGSLGGGLYLFVLWYGFNSRSRNLMNFVRQK